MLAKMLLHYLFTSQRCLLCSTEQIEGPLCPRCYAGLELLQGNRCTTCSAPLISEERVCTRCRNRNFSFSGSTSLFSYEGDVKELIHQYKFNHDKQLSRTFAQLLYDTYLAHLPPDTVIVPVPARRVTKKHRGWDHMEIIAKHLEKKYGVEVLYCLTRNGSMSQKSLDYAGRMRNLQGKILVKPSPVPLPEKVLLIDDVFTTGATIEQCSCVLRTAGVTEVSALTLALD